MQTWSLPDEVAKARCLFEWARDSLPHTDDAGLEIVTCTASEVLHHGTGICFAKSHLLAAVLRAIDIPAGFCYQVLRLDPPADIEPVLHGLNALYLATIDRWIRVDARGNTNGISAQFSLVKEQLAIAMDPEADEFIYETIFAAPVGSVVSRLKMYKTRSELWEDLLQSLQQGCYSGFLLTCFILQQRKTLLLPHEKARYSVGFLVFRHYIRQAAMLINLVVN